MKCKFLFAYLTFVGRSYVRYAKRKRNLHFIFYSIDDIDDYEISPVASFDPSLSERDKLSALRQLDGMLHDAASSVVTNY